MLEPKISGWSPEARPRSAAFRGEDKANNQRALRERPGKLLERVNKILLGWQVYSIAFLGHVCQWSIASTTIILEWKKLRPVAQQMVEMLSAH